MQVVIAARYAGSPEFPCIFARVAHASGVPVLHTKHSTQKVVEAAGLRIATPIEFFRTLAAGIRESAALR